MNRRKEAVNLIERMNAIGMTQAELARAIGVHEASISRYKHGKSTPTREIYIKMRRAVAAAEADERRDSEKAERITTMNENKRNDASGELALEESMSEYMKFAENLAKFKCKMKGVSYEDYIRNLVWNDMKEEVRKLF